MITTNVHGCVRPSKGPFRLKPISQKCLRSGHCSRRRLIRFLSRFPWSALSRSLRRRQLSPREESMKKQFSETGFPVNALLAPRSARFHAAAPARETAANGCRTVVAPCRGINESQRHVETNRAFPFYVTRRVRRRGGRGEEAPHIRGSSGSVFFPRLQEVGASHT